jgi:hypothetical protein
MEAIVVPNVAIVKVRRESNGKSLVELEPVHA